MAGLKIDRILKCTDHFLFRSKGPARLDKAHEGCISSCHFSNDGKTLHYYTCILKIFQHVDVCSYCIQLHDLSIKWCLSFTTVYFETIFHYKTTWSHHNCDSMWLLKSCQAPLGQVYCDEQNIWNSISQPISFLVGGFLLSQTWGDSILREVGLG